MSPKPKSPKKLWYKQLNKCSLCGATLVYNLLKCPNCGNINTAEQIVEDKETEEPADLRKAFFSSETKVALRLSVVLFIFMIFALFFLTQFNSLMLNLRTVVFAIYFLAGIVQGLIIFDDANRLSIGLREDAYGHNWPKPVTWFLAAVFFFPIVSPFYLFVRSNYSAVKFRTLILALSIVVFFLAIFCFNHAFTDAEPKLSTLEQARIEQEEKRLSDPVSFYREAALLQQSAALSQTLENKRLQ